MVSWGIFDQYDSMNVLDSTWAFKCKRCPGGLVQKSKTWFFARGNQQLENFISLKPIRQCCSGQRFDWCLFLNYYWFWSPSKSKLPLHFSMQTSLIIRRYTLKRQEGLNSSPIMDARNVWNWKSSSLVSVIFYVHSGNTWRRSWSKVFWSSQSLIPEFLLVRKSHILYTLMIL